MWLKFHKNRCSDSEEITATDQKNVVLRKTRLKFFLMKIFEKVRGGFARISLHIRMTIVNLIMSIKVFIGKTLSFLLKLKYY